MEPEIGIEDDALTDEDGGLTASQPWEDIVRDPEAWEFFAAIRALAAAHPDLPGVGRSSRIEQDHFRFRQQPSLKMEHAEITQADRLETPDGPVTALSQTFFGPFGPHGALPEHVTEDALDAQRLGSTDIQDFTNLFTHRMVSLLYRAWETTQIAVSRDRGQDDNYKRWISSLYGQGPAPFANRDSLPDDLKRFMSSWMANPRGSVAAIESVLSALTGVRIEVDEFIAEWLPIPEEDQSRLGVGPAGLGRDIVLGSRSYSVQSRLRVRTSRLNFSQFEALLPDGTHHAALRDAMRNLIGLDGGWELQLVLDGQDVPRLALDGTRRLGWDSWAVQDDRFSNAVDVIIEGTY